MQLSDVTPSATRPDGLYDLDAPDSVIGRWETEDVRKVQLVACVTMTRGARARTCGYIGKPPVTMYWRDYRFVVREARTGRQVAPATRLRAEQTTCAELVLAKPDGTLRSQFSAVSARQLERALGGYHSGPAR